MTKIIFQHTMTNRGPLRANEFAAFRAAGILHGAQINGAWAYTQEELDHLNSHAPKTLLAVVLNFKGKPLSTHLRAALGEVRRYQGPTLTPTPGPVSTRAKTPPLLTAGEVADGFGIDLPVFLLAAGLAGVHPDASGFYDAKDISDFKSIIHSKSN